MPQLVNVVISPLPVAYSYTVPPELESLVSIGSLVEVPLGRRIAKGFVIEKRDVSQAELDASKYAIKAIQTAVLDYPLFNEEQLIFFKWIAGYYRENLSTVIDVAIPSPAPRLFKRAVSLASFNESELKGKLQKELINFLKTRQHSVSMSELSRRFKGAAASLKRLHEKGFVTFEEEEVLDQHISIEDKASWAKNEVVLNSEQTEATDAVISAALNDEFKSFLLHGVTGSGKTEVYIEAIKDLRAQGRGALVIVPEIALTPQLIDRFRVRLGDELAILHSALSKRARWDAWRALLEGRNLVAIGARSAIFAPVPNLSLIVVDEEHDNSYKQGDSLRYNARDLAVVRGKQHNAPVLLGSATPSLESYLNAAKKKYQFFSLPARHKDSSSISVEIVDLNLSKPWEMPSPNVSPRLFELIAEAVMHGDQAFVLYNRRGFASFLQCENCGAAVQCPNCSVTLTFHKGHNSLRCHYCSLELGRPEFCNQCEVESEDKSNKLVMRGAGTEKVFDELKALFPDTAIDRLDRDTTRNNDDYRAILDRMRSKESLILVGTQMIAKGHDLPDVTVVGVVDCDIGLHMPDFRAGERVFQLLTQVAGRAGRGSRNGQVILQTRVPKHPSLQHTLTQDFRSFARNELAIRQQLNYPPFSRLLRIVASSQEQSLAPRNLKLLRDAALELIDKKQLNIHILGPAPAPLEKLKTLWRWHLLLRAAKSVELGIVLEELRKIKVLSNKIKLTFDLDPQDML